jgi:membrane protein
MSESLVVGRSLVQEWRDDRVSGLAAEVAFFGMLSVFPGFLALAAALGSLESLVGGELAADAEERVLDVLRRVLTDEAESTIAAVERLFEDASPGVFTLGLLLATWAASRGFAAVITALDVAYDLDERRTWWRLRAVAVGLALGTVLVVTLLLAMLVIGPLLGTGQDVADAIGLGGAFATAWDWARWPVVLLLAVAWAATIFHIAPNHTTPWRWDLPGALLSALAWVAVSTGFSAYLRVAGSANQVFGTLGGGLIALVWFYLLAASLLAGAELNAVLAQRRADGGAERPTDNDSAASP